MKNYNFNLLVTFGIVLFLAGCTKKQELDITMTQVNHGQLNVRIVDQNDNPLEDVQVYLEGRFSSDLEIKKTDGNGWVQFNNILSGDYLVTINNIEIDGKSYDVSQGVQVISDLTKEYTIDPTEYIGTATITILEYNNTSSEYEPVDAGLTVRIFDSDEYINDAGIPSIAMESQTTDSQGQVVFNELIFRQYGLGVYDDQDNLLGADNYLFSINRKGQELRRIYQLPD